MIPKQKWLARLTEDPNLAKKVAVTLPRIGFEISGIEYDASRKQNKVIKAKKVLDGADNDQLKSGFMSVLITSTLNCSLCQRVQMMHYRL